MFQKIIIPEVVRDEMIAPGAPPVLQKWIANPPSWLTIELPETIAQLQKTNFRVSRRIIQALLQE